ncbi:NAD(P)-dependent oxidoreductase [Rubrimonas cliftonensis]|uniref:3-hydroxyisobutyrate dehydrogenase n=1 Tax=Rubrimonas cliftonensis TaxID=89524 RepID=A0A1H3VK77_9RHOB|nr:NAD(P)-dependent oxidoreductase [Rubrimonas cliftonensis]SDZ75203.1 3-hydroxyisobutyrate dehydrogenase [Rubrimonas cliftonensis]
MTEGLRIGFCGLGRMGAPMAANLARAGFALTLWNRTGAKAAALAAELGAELGAEAAPTPAALAGASDVVVSMVADDAASEALHLGRDGLAEAAPGRLFVAMSTVSPAHVRALGAELAGRGGALVDAPVSGSVAAAEDAQLLIMAGGDAGDIARARPALLAMGRAVRETGPLGSAAHMKIVVNCLIHGLNQTLAEALTLAEAGGVDAPAAYAVIEDSAAAAPMLRYRKPQYLDGEASPVSFALGLAAKDMALALALAREGGVAMPQAEITHALLARAEAAGLGAADMAAMLRFMREGGAAQ